MPPLLLLELKLNYDWGVVGGAVPIDIALITLEYLQGLDLPDLAARGEDMVKVGHRVSRRQGDRTGARGHLNVLRVKQSLGPLLWHSFQWYRL